MVNGEDSGLVAPEGVLQHTVTYTPLPTPPIYRSDASFNPRGMEHVYLLANTFLDLIQRDNVLPPSMNVSSIHEDFESTPGSPGSPDHFFTFSSTLLKEHWQDIMLQNVGILTTAIFGIFLAIIIPIIGFCFCCCRCCGRCAAYPDEHYDKRSDACKRVFLGILVCLFVMATVFGVVCAFVTNYYSYQGSQHLTTKLDDSLEDTGVYLEHTGAGVRTLLVTNYDQLENVIGEVLDDSGVILKNALATVSKAIAINNLTAIVSGLGQIRLNLKDIRADTRTLEEKVLQLKDGLGKAQESLVVALKDCNQDARCGSFLKEYNLEEDLALAEEFVNIKFEMPDLASTLQGVSDLIQNDIENKVLSGKAQFDSIEKEIEKSIDDIKPKVKLEIRALGEELDRQNADIQAALREVDIGVIQKDIPLIDHHSQPFFEYRYYIGIGLSSLILLILLCFVFGLFYGMCGKRPGDLYGDECCNKGTGANCLVTGIYLTFLFSFVILVLTTAHFLIGATIEKVVCESLKSPQDSDLFQQVDQKYLQPTLSEILNNGRLSKEHYTAVELIESCHANQTIFSILKLERVYNLSQLSNWRAHYGIGEFIENLKNKVQLDQLADIRLLSTETERDLRQLAETKISDMDFTRFMDLLEDQITKIDLRSFISKLRQLKEVWRFEGSTLLSTQIENQALWLEGMNKVVADMKVTLRHLKSSVLSLQENSRFNQTSMRVAITGLIDQANSASSYLRSNGPNLVTDLTTQFAGEIVGLIDQYATRVNMKIKHEVGFCAPLSTSLNATVIALCNEIVDPWNGFWAAIGWCFLLYLPVILLGVPLISLYRKSEPYPGPLVESQPLELGGGAAENKNRKKGHRRNPSAFLPEYTHSRPTPPQNQFAEPARYRDIAPRNYGSDEVSPPRYTSNPSLPGPAGGGEYERPPPYYYPGPPE
jgi:prominin 1